MMYNNRTAYLVVALLTTSNLIVIGRPEAGTVGCEDLIHEDDVIILCIVPELELRVGNDDATLRCVVAGLWIMVLA